MGWPLALAIAVFLESNQSRLALPDTGLPSEDKIGHFHLYGLLATLVVRAVYDPNRRWRAAAIAVLCASLYGVSDEFHQSFTPGRGVEFLDWVADTSGAALAVTLYCIWPLYRRILEYPLWRRRPPASGIAPGGGARDAATSDR